MKRNMVIIFPALFAFDFFVGAPAIGEISATVKPAVADAGRVLDEKPDLKEVMPARADAVR